MIDVRSVEAGVVLVFVAPDVDEDSIDVIRVLARMEWPDERIVVGRRASVGGSGAQVRFKSLGLFGRSTFRAILALFSRSDGEEG